MAIETNRSSRPNIRWWRVSEKGFITGEGAIVPTVEFIQFPVASPRRTVMEWGLQNLGTKLSPVGLSIEQVQVPNPIDIFRRRHWMSGSDGEKGKLFVFCNCPFCVFKTPAILPSQSPAEGEIAGAIVERKFLNALVKFGVGFVHRVLSSIVVLFEMGRRFPIGDFLNSEMPQILA